MGIVTETYCPKDLMVEWKQYFDTFTKDGKTVTADNFEAIQRYAGFYVSESKCETLLGDLKVLTFEDCAKYLKVLAIDNDYEKQIVDAFSEFKKKDTDLLEIEHFKYIMKNLGEFSTEEELNEFLRHIPSENGCIKFDDFVKHALPK